MSENIVLTVKEIFRRSQAIIIDEHFVYAKKPDGWYHGPDYVNKDAIYVKPAFVSLLCQSMAMHFQKNNIEVVVGPTVGAVNLATWTAHWLAHFCVVSLMLNDKIIQVVCADEEDVLHEEEVLNVGLEVLPDNRYRATFPSSGPVTVIFNSEHYFVSATCLIKTGTRRVLKRGYDKIVRGKRCLIVEDIINSGATVQKTKKAVEDAGGIVVGVGALCNRSGGNVTAETLGVPELFSLLDLEMKMYKEDDCPICKENGLESVRTDLGKGKEFLQRIGKLPK